MGSSYRSVEAGEGRVVTEPGSAVARLIPYRLAPTAAWSSDSAWRNDSVGWLEHIAPLEAPGARLGTTDS